MIKLAYVAGPYRNGSESGVWQNIMVAREHAIRLHQHGYFAICPHLNTMFMGGVSGGGDAALPDQWWLDGDCEIIRRLRPDHDILYLLPGWEKSTGAKQEYLCALDCGLEIVTTWEMDRRWKMERTPPKPSED